MAFGFNGNGAPFAAPTQNAGGSVQTGRELKEIHTEQLGFLPICGDSKLQLLPTPWPADALPLPSSSLLAVASSKGLVAAASPSELIIASTTSIRKAWITGPASENNVRSFTPEIKITVPRLSHVVFSADDKVLVVAEESTGDLAAYEIDALPRGQTKPALEVSTDKQPLRALVPNPNVQFTELFAAVTTKGDLLLADLKAGQLRPGTDGRVLGRNVSCLSWSNQGKQLVAGLGDGTAVQMTPDGSLKAEIPRPPSLEGDKHVSSLSWLSNDNFLIIYSVTAIDDTAQPSDYFFVTRQPKTQNYVFQALPEICPAFGLNRSPACHFVARLRNFKPHIEDLLLLASTTAMELGTVTKADAPLSPENAITDSYTVTMPADDSRQAQLPLSLDSSETSPIGMALDLSAQDVVMGPIPSDPEIQESAGPLPNVFVLNQEGVLSSWWIVYTDSVREKKTYSGLVAGATSNLTQEKATPEPVQATSSPATTFGQPAFGQPGFGQSGFATQSPFAKPAVSTFGSGSDTKFGSPSPLSGDKPSWTSTGFGNTPSQAVSSGFGQPAFGTATPFGGVNHAFGDPSSLATKPALGQPAAPTSSFSSGTTFGQADALGAKKPNPFGGGGSASPFGGTPGKGEGFAAFSKDSGFAALASNQAGKESSFGKPVNKESGFLRSEQPSPFAPRSDTGETKSALSGLGGSGFALTSTFRSNESPQNGKSKPEDTGGSSFGAGLEEALDQTSGKVEPSNSKEEEMDELDSIPDSESRGSSTDTIPLPPAPKPPVSVVTPPSAISQPKVTPAPPLAGLFSTGHQPGTTPAAVQNSIPGWSFAQASSTTPKETPKTKPFSFPTASDKEDDTPQIKTEPSNASSPELHEIPEAPLPPDPVSKAPYTTGDTTDTSEASKVSNEEEPLPADPVPPTSGSPGEVSEAGFTDDEDDGLSSDFKGSGEDETHEISPVDEPTEDQAEQIQTSPESSFGKGAEDGEESSPAGGLFTKVSTSKPSKLFGEITTGPILPPPGPHESPRSPSPVRKTVGSDVMRPETSRSVSAPTRPQSSSALDRRRTELTRSALASQSVIANDKQEMEMERKKAAEKAKAKAEAEAELKLEDDEDSRLRAELEAPLTPSEVLEPFLPHQHNDIDNSNKTGIPGQIERLYQDINSMIDTLGINARSLSSYLLYQTSRRPDHEWPKVLVSETPCDVFNKEWLLQDIVYLPEGEESLSTLLIRSRIDNVSEKFEYCQDLLNRDVIQLRTRLMSTRNALHANMSEHGRSSAPLSPEQANLQHDLRKASMAVQSKLVEAEQELTVLRARLAEARPVGGNDMNGTGRGMLSRASQQSKPTVEAVTSTIAKMTSMAEKKSSDVDVLEAQLQNLGLASVSRGRYGSVEPNGTPPRDRSGPGTSPLLVTPKSGSGSVYHTPGSKFGDSNRSTPTTWRRSLHACVDGNGALVLAEDSMRWKEESRRRKEVHRLLADALAERRNAVRAVKG